MTLPAARRTFTPRHSDAPPQPQRRRTLRLDLHIHHHYDDFRIRALLAELLGPIIQREEDLMALSAKLQAAVDAANAGVANANNELEAIAGALASSANVGAAAVATALAKQGIDEDAAADAINSARVSIQEHVDSIFQKIGVPQPVPVPPVPVGPDPLVFADPELPEATAGQGYHGHVEVTGGTGPVTFAASPPTANGLLFNSDGTLSGTPADAGPTSFSITATDSGAPPQTADLSVIINVVAAVAEAPETLVLTTTLPDGDVGQGYTSTLGIGGGTEPYSVSSSPAAANGVAIDGAGNVAGTPIEAGDTRFDIIVTDSGSPQQEARGTAILHVEPAASVEDQGGADTQNQGGDA